MGVERTPLTSESNMRKIAASLCLKELFEERINIGYI